MIKSQEELRRSCPERKEQRKLHGLTEDGKYVSYKSAAKQRGVIFELTKEEFISFWKKSCEYCGSKIDTIGLDRIDNTKGYEITNIKACCKICNYMKRDQTVTFFSNKITDIITHISKPLDKIHSNRSKKFSSYKYGANKRNLEFELSSEQFKNITNHSCYYCGSIESIGIDRVDNNIGYLLENVVPCCKFCNLAKHKLSTDEFISHVKKIHNHLKQGTNDVRTN